MATELKPYPRYRDSGVEWLGAVPADWEVEKLKESLANVVDQAAESPRGDTVVALEDVESWTGRVALADSPPSFESQLKRFRSGDVLFGKLRPYLAKVARLTNDGLCVGEFLVLRPRHGGVSGPYFERLLRSKPIIDAVTASTYGAKMPRADWRFIGTMPVVRPPLAEQAAIVRFLNHADQRIRRYIRAKEKLIELLEEQKQAIIHEAVTGRVDVRTGRPYPAYKDSGAEWLGAVPAHWEVRRLGRFGRLFKGGGGTKEDERESGVPWVRYGDLYTRHQFFISATRACVTPELASTVYTAIRYGDVLFAGSGETIDEIGKSAVNLIPGAACCGGDVIILRPSIDADARFVGYAMDCAATARQKASIGRGFTIVHIYSSDLKCVTVAMPSLSEQSAIAGFLDKGTRDTESGINRARRRIELLREYSTRVVADVVTGKIDVRKAAARLAEVDALDVEAQPGGIDVQPEGAGWRDGAEAASPEVDAGDAG